MPSVFLWLCFAISCGYHLKVRNHIVQLEANLATAQTKAMQYSLQKVCWRLSATHCVAAAAKVSRHWASVPVVALAAQKGKEKIESWWWYVGCLYVNQLLKFSKIQKLLVLLKDEEFQFTELFAFKKVYFQWAGTPCSITESYNCFRKGFR